MLPDVKKRQKIKSAYERKSFDGRAIEAALDMKKADWDGYSTQNCLKICRELNSYFEESRYLMIQMTVIFKMLQRMRSGDKSIAELYQDHGSVMVGQSMGNLMRVMKSLSKQRRLFKGLKLVLKNNVMTSEWESLMDDQIKGLKKREAYIREIIIPANIKCTPLAVFGLIGVDIYKDICDFVNNDSEIYDQESEQNKIADAYVEKALLRIREIPAETMQSVTAGIAEEKERRDTRLESLSKIREIEKEEKLKKEIEQGKNDVLAFCGSAQKIFEHERMNALKYWANSHSRMYVVAAAKQAPFRSGYLTRGVNKVSLWRVSTARDATLFKSMEKAKEAAAVFKGMNEHNIAEISEIEIAKYSYKNKK